MKYIKFFCISLIGIFFLVSCQNTFDMDSSNDIAFWLGSDGIIVKSYCSGKLEITTDPDAENQPSYVNSTKISLKKGKEVVVKSLTAKDLGKTFYYKTPNSTAFKKFDLYEDYESFMTGQKYNLYSVDNSGSIFSARANMTSVVKDGKIFVIAGTDINDEYKNDVWSSVDGLFWEKEVSNASFSPRTKTTAVVKQNTIYLAAGMDTAFMNDVWKSTDGVNWSSVTIDPEKHWLGKLGIQFLQNDPNENRLFLTGGAAEKTTDESGKLKNNALYYSEDFGQVWIKKDTHDDYTGFSGTSGYKALYLNGNIYLLFGSQHNDVQNPSTGEYDFMPKRKVIRITDKPNIDVHSDIEVYTIDKMPQIFNFAACVHNDELYVFGGANYEYTGGTTSTGFEEIDMKDINQVWHSANGEKWTKIENASDIMWGPRDGFESASKDKILYLLGGQDYDLNKCNEVWRSLDNGKTWQLRVFLP